jgi:hypothetical protein
MLGLKQYAYNLSARNKEAVNEVLDPLRANRRVEAMLLG